MTINKLLLVALLSCSLFGQSAKEKALQAQLDAAHAALDASTRAADQLAQELAKANAAAVAKAAMAARAGKNDAATVAAAAADAAADAATAQIIATANGEAARKAAQDAALLAQGAAATARAQNIALMITQSFGFLAVVAGLLWKGYTEARDRRWALEDQRTHQKDVIDKLGQVKNEAHAAYKEANTVNAKIAAIGMQMKDNSPAVEPAPKSMWGAGGGTT
jgi:hypothetical protein